MSLAWRLALRDLRGGLTGLRLLAVCIILGVAALAGVGSLGAAIVKGLEAQGRVILGGDIELQLTQQTASAAQRAAFGDLGTVSTTVRMRAMAARPDGAEAVLAELKAVDDRYPLYGELTLSAGRRPRGQEVAIAPALADRLRVGVGDKVRIGNADLGVSGIIASEPDRVGAGFSLGATAMVDPAGMAATRLVQPGSLYDSEYRIRLKSGLTTSAAEARLERAFPDADWRFRDSSNAAPSVRRFVERLGQFLTLVGLTALVVAGIGVTNGVASYLDGKRPGIATLKALGASSAMIFRIYLIQIGLVTAGAVVVGLGVGLLVPWVVLWVAGDALPVPPQLGLHPVPLLIAAVYGALVAVVFALAPLAQARGVAAAALFRGGVETLPPPSRGVIAIILAAALGIAALAITTAREPGVAAIFLAAATGLLVVLALVGRGVVTLARRLPRPRRPLLRLAIANLHAPATQTERLVIALGLGLSLFALLAVVETNLSGQINRVVPAKAPSFFILDIPSADLDRFRALVKEKAPDGTLVTVPSLRGPVVEIGGQRVADMKNIPDNAWVLRGDRGLTFAATLPAGNRVVEGAWWSADYAGPPLVSLDIDAARALGLKIGDSLTVSVLGVEVPARIASFREIDWDSLGFNFAIIFAPGALEGAPHTFAATLAMDPTGEAGLNRAVTAAFPSVSLIRVKDVVIAVTEMMGQMSVAVRAAASVAIAAGIAVLIGAIAAARRARTYDAVLLKLLGATRGQVLLSQALEYALLALVVAALALAIGAAGGWYVVTQLFDLDWMPDWPTVGLTLVAGAVLTLGLGLAGSLPALAARPARALRAL